MYGGLTFFDPLNGIGDRFVQIAPIATRQLGVDDQAADVGTGWVDHQQLVVRLDGLIDPAAHVQQVRAGAQRRRRSAVEDQRAVVHCQRFVVALKGAQDGSPVAEARRALSCQIERPIDALQSLLRPIEILQYSRAIVERFGIGRSRLKRRVEARQGLLEPDELLQRNAAVVQRLGIARVDGQQPVECGDSLGGLAEPKLDRAKKMQARNAARLELQGALALRKRPSQVAAAVQLHGLLEPGLGVPGLLHSPT